MMLWLNVVAEKTLCAILLNLLHPRALKHLIALVLITVLTMALKNPLSMMITQRYALILKTMKVIVTMILQRAWVIYKLSLMSIPFVTAPQLSVMELTPWLIAVDWRPRSVMIPVLKAPPPALLRIPPTLPQVIKDLA